MRYLSLLVCVLFIFSCKEKNKLPPGILKQEKMQEVFWDYINADVYVTDYIKKDSTKNPIVENLKLQNRIFKTHHITKESFYKSYTYYSNHKELMNTMIDSIVAKKQREKIITNNPLE